MECRILEHTGRKIVNNKAGNQTHCQVSGSYTSFVELTE